MKKHHGIDNRSSTRSFGRKKLLNPDELVRHALKKNRVATEQVQSTANHLNTLILKYRINIVPEATIVRESATLLQHVEQNFRRLTETLLKEDPWKHDSMAQ